MDAGAKNRVRLWLRAERALGLKSVPVAQSLLRSPINTNMRQPGASSVPPAAARAAPRPSDQRPTPPAKPPVAASAAETTPSHIPLPVNQPFESPMLSTEEKRVRLAQLNETEVKGCTRCRLCEQRTNTVFGEGDVDAQIFFIGEGPGENEDLSGRPFVGRAGQLLDKMIAGMGLRRDQVFIANIVKCRPPNNRAPVPDEVATCTPYLERQLEIVRPKVIVTLGLPAVTYMLQRKTTMGRIRGQWQDWRGIKLMPTFHPAYLLRNYTPDTRRAVWEDLKKVMAEIGLPVPEQKK